MQFFKKIIVAILTWEARLVLARYSPRIIAVTGSVGKTTTKDAIFAALSSSLRIRKSQKSFNSELGVPLTILGLENAWQNPFKWIANIVSGFLLIIVKSEYPEWLVLEVGADRPNDIKNVARWLRPDIAVITAIPEIPVHVEFFDSPEAVLREKRQLAEYMKPGGTLVVNGDDPRMSDLRSDFHGRSVTFGIEGNDDFFASESRVLYSEGKPLGMMFRANHSETSEEITIRGSLGYPRVSAALAALAVADTVGIDLANASAGLLQWSPPPGRMRVLSGIRSSTVIDDTYNSSPAAVLAALDTLASIETTGRKIAILGDMLELGRYSTDAHRHVGERAAQCADMLITIGFRARVIGEAALDAGMSDVQVREYEVGEAERAAVELVQEIREGDIILVKGSQSMRMEKTVALLLEEPSKAPELLVRQESEWKDR